MKKGVRRFCGTVIVGALAFVALGAVAASASAAL